MSPSAPGRITRQIAGDQIREPAHHEVAAGRIRLEDFQHFLAVQSEHARALAAGGARDAMRLVLEQGVPAEKLAFAEPEACRPCALAAADQELDAPRFEHEEIV